MKKFILIVFFLVSGSAQAAQVGKVVTDNAKVYEFPKSNSNVIATAKKNEQLPVSNVPTEGFYKVKTRSGVLGWVSGSDILVNKSAESSNPRSAEKPVKRKRYESESSTEETDQGDFYEHSRIIIAGGLESLSYGGVPSNFNAKNLNLGWNGLVEFQFQMDKLFFWAIRTELFYAKTSGTISTTKQSLKYFAIPVELGIIYSPVTLKGLRLGLGAYLGAAVLSTLSVTQETPALNSNVDFASFDPVGELSLQADFGLSNRTGIFFEAAYRYHKTSTFGSTTSLGGVSGFSADYSGILGRAGFEFRL